MPQIKTRHLFTVATLFGFVAATILLTSFFVPARVHADITWTHPLSGQYWLNIASSADGTRLVATRWYDYVYTSSDGGVTWAAQLGSGSTWRPRAVAMSADGTHIAISDWYGPDGVNPGYFYTSSDGGVTWTQQSGIPLDFHFAIAMSADGSRIVTGGTQSGYIYTSLDGGTTWTPRTSAGTHGWFSFASSADGMKLAAVGDKYVFTSLDGGVTWTQRAGAGPDKMSVASSADGMKLFAAGYHYSDSYPFATGTYLYTSSDGGETWTAQVGAGARNWMKLSASSDGTKLVALANDLAFIGTYYVYSSSDGGVSWSQQSGAGTISSLQIPGLVISSNGLKIGVVWWSGSSWSSIIGTDTAPPPATCSSTLSPTSINQGQSSTLTWTSSDADWMYINNVGYVAASGSTSVAPSATTDYSCEASGTGGSDGWHSASLTVHASCTFTPAGGGGTGTPVITYRTSGTTWTVPSDWNNSNNTIEVIGGGGGASSDGWVAGGGGAYAKSTNIVLTPGTSITYSVGAGGAGGTSLFGGGSDGGDTYVCNSANSCSSISDSVVVVGAKGGGRGAYVSTSASGGSVANSVGAVKYSGGGASDVYSGGGGAAGPHGPGNNGTSDGYYGNGIGGSGDAGFGGAGGIVNQSGGNGTEWDATHGAGGGGGMGGGGEIYGYPHWGGTGCANGRPGGLYGGGGGSEDCNLDGGAGAPGLIVITYTPTTGNQTITHNSSVTTYQADTVPYGQTCASESRTCTDGTLSGTYAYTSCTVADQSCTPSTVYTCSGTQTIVRTDTSAQCAITTTNTTCNTPQFCSVGSPACLDATPSFAPFTDSDGTLQDGHFKVRPSIVPKGKPTKLYWKVDSVSLCSVHGTNDQNWTGIFSGSSGTTTANIQQQTTFTLTCRSLAEGTPVVVNESKTVNILPAFQEK